MSKKQNRKVHKNDNGNWANKRNDASRANSVHNTQREAGQAARQNQKNQAVVA